ncbi:hypothetical protein PQR53_16275 [Paraburkholderia fungorum]|uniref:fimbrial protein n=1 Tax=Paraburkholderia fungorum TaxID=134537 RepID=UPI0038B8AF54
MLNLGLQCDAHAKPAISLMDSATPSNQTNALTLSPGSSAAGLGIQLLYQMTPISFGPANYTYTTSNTPSTSNVSLGTRTGTENVPLMARYIQTAAVLKPGTSRAAATFTMNYNQAGKPAPTKNEPHNASRRQTPTRRPQVKPEAWLGAWFAKPATPNAKIFKPQLALSPKIKRSPL